jgi:hypothetical protein
MTNPLSVHSLGVADVILRCFFPELGLNRDSAVALYGDEATLSWQGTDHVALSTISTTVLGLKFR